MSKTSSSRCLPGSLKRGNVGPKSHRDIPPFPKQQMLVLALCRICEPIAFMGIFPYIYYMIEDFHVTNDESKISFYAGMVTSAFTLAECSTGILWGRLSDRVGRKPILLTGLAGTALSVLVFGFAPSLPVALFARALGGLLNGNIGVLQTTVAELITVKEHQSRAYTIMPFIWCLGSIIGPMIGGALARPCINYPSIFAPGTIFERFPYLLPNLFSAFAVFCGVTVGILFLEETHPDKKTRHDPGLALGRIIISWFDSWKHAPAKQKDPTIKQHDLDVKGKRLEADLLEAEPLIDPDDELPIYRSTEASPKLHYMPSSQKDQVDVLDLLDTGDLETGRHVVDPAPTCSRPKVFTRSIILIIVSYGILAFHTMTFEQLFAVFLSTAPRENRDHWKLPFKFDDGFGMTTKEIGVILAIQGGYSMISNIFIFPFVNNRVGARMLFRFLSTSYFLLYLAAPYVVLLPASIRPVGIYGLIIWKCTYNTLAYPSNAILLTNSALSNKILGTINGVAASTASLCRAFGPTISGALYTLGLQTGYSGLAWWCSGAISTIGAFISLYIPEPCGRMDAERQHADVDEHVEADETNGSEDYKRSSLLQSKPGTRS